MPTYEYQCDLCGLRFERRQPITEESVTECPECHGEVRRLVSGGAGFMLKGSGNHRVGRKENGCSLESSGTTCCGRDERCGKPPCGDKG
jgi:putative FmdB family regulatory protein